MGLLLLLLLLAVIFGAVGFLVHALWIVAVVLLIGWVIAAAWRGITGRSKSG